MKIKYLVAFILCLLVLITYQIQNTEPYGDTVTLIWPTITITATDTALPVLTQLPATATSTQKPTIEPSVTPIQTMLPRPTGMFGAPSLEASDIDRILCQAHSPACGYGTSFFELGIKYQINPAYALAFFKKESSFGTDPNWHGVYYPTHNVGNIECNSKSVACHGRWSSYNSWHNGIEAWYSLISRKYYGMDLYSLLAVYAPSFDGNSPRKYANTVLQLVNQWSTR